jgi:hypothetical protein
MESRPSSLTPNDPLADINQVEIPQCSCAILSVGSTGSTEKRCEFITFIGGAAVAVTACTQPPTKLARIGALYIGLADTESFKKELRE